MTVIMISLGEPPPVWWVDIEQMYANLGGSSQCRNGYLTLISPPEATKHRTPDRKSKLVQHFFTPLARGACCQLI